MRDARWPFIVLAVNAAVIAALFWPRAAPAQLAPGFSGSSSQLTMDDSEAMRRDAGSWGLPLT